MSTCQAGNQPLCYQIQVWGYLGDRWAEWFDGLALSHECSGTTTLTGCLADQTALHGVLTKIRDLGLPLVSVILLNIASGDSE